MRVKRNVFFKNLNSLKMEKEFTFKNNLITLVGRWLKINSYAPNFEVTTNDLTKKTLIDFKDKIKIITSFPSLDTEVCDLLVKQFNKKAFGLSNEIMIIPISKDLPFAQKRFCQTYDVDNIEVFSDYKTSSFGINYGLLIKELNLLARSAIILDKNNVIRYIQIASELTNHLDFDDLFHNLQKVIENPAIKLLKEKPIKCQACEGKLKLLSDNEIKNHLSELNLWQLIDNKIEKEFKFKDFLEAKYFLDLLSVIAQEQNHHPIFVLNYNKLKVSLTTHTIHNLSENDFVFAKIIDEIRS
jgi:thioredoxin-dependent peroxiredoxin